MANFPKKALLFFILLLVIGCSGGAEPVSLQIPFGGALTSDSTVAIADGNPVGGNPIGSLSTKSQQIGGKLFRLTDPSGNNIGTMEFGEGMKSATTVNGIQSSYSMPVCYQINNGGCCINSMLFFQFPYDDPNVNANEVRGAASGICDNPFGEGFDSSQGKVIEFRYVAAVTGEGLFSDLTHAVSIIH